MQMLNLGVIEIAYDENFALKLTAVGRQVLFGKKKIDLTILPDIKTKEKPAKSISSSHSAKIGRAHV